VVEIFGNFAQVAGDCASHAGQRCEGIVPQGLKPRPPQASGGTTKVVPFHKRIGNNGLKSFPSTND
jgi:hypothetical protein